MCCLNSSQTFYLSDSRNQANSVAIVFDSTKLYRETTKQSFSTPLTWCLHRPVASIKWLGGLSEWPTLTPTPCFGPSVKAFFLLHVRSLLLSTIPFVFVSNFLFVLDQLRTPHFFKNLAGIWSVFACDLSEPIRCHLSPVCWIETWC